MENKIRYQGLIFDLDGTLVNSLEDIADSMNSILSSRSFPVHHLEDYKLLIGHGLRNLVTNALPPNHRRATVIDESLVALIDHYRHNCLNKTKAYDGIADLLQELKFRNLKMAVFSNKADELTRQIVNHSFPDCPFSPVIGFTKEELKKPAPEVPLAIAKQWRIRPSDIIYIGDSGVDMQTANNAGMFALGALWGFRSKEEIISNGANYLINHPADLIAIL